MFPLLKIELFSVEHEITKVVVSGLSCHLNITRLKISITMHNCGGWNENGTQAQANILK